VPNIVSKTAIVYSVLWLLSFWIQNIIFSTIVGGFGVVLLVVVAMGVDNLFVENYDNDEKLRIELEKLRKEIDEIKSNRRIL
jgi:hypothetical protein